MPNVLNVDNTISLKMRQVQIIVACDWGGLIDFLKRYAAVKDWQLFDNIFV